MENTPKIGSHYRHYKGNNYKVIDIILARVLFNGYSKNVVPVEEISNLDSQLVVYESIDGAKVWARELSDFMGIVSTDEGTHFYRFELIK